MEIGSASLAKLLFWLFDVIKAFPNLFDDMMGCLVSLGLLLLPLCCLEAASLIISLSKLKHNFFFRQNMTISVQNETFYDSPVSITYNDIVSL